VEPYPNLRLAVNGNIIKDLITTNTTAINPTSFIFRSSRFNTNWNKIEIYDLDTKDYSPQNNNADQTYLSQITYEENGKINSALKFNGNLKIPNSPTIDVTGSELTLSAWIKPSWDETTDAYHYLFDKRNGSEGNNYNSYRFFFHKNIDDWRFRITTDTGTSNCDTTGITITPNVWQQLTARYDGTNQSIWINGEKKAECAKTGNIIGNTHDLYIGAQRNNWNPFGDPMDEIKMWNRALTDQEIVDLANN